MYGIFTYHLPLENQPFIYRYIYQSHGMVWVMGFLYKFPRNYSDMSLQTSSHDELSAICRISWMDNLDGHHG